MALVGLDNAKAKSPLEGISKALDIVGTIYGIQANSAKTDEARQQLESLKQKAEQDKALFSQKQALEVEKSDPNSKSSQIAKSDANAFLGIVQNSKLGQKPENREAISKLQTLIQDPNTNARQLEDHLEKSPLVKYMSQAMAAQEKAAASQISLNFRDEARKERNELATNSKYGQEMGLYEKTVMGANRALTIIDKIGSGDLKGTKQLKSDLAASLASMMNGGRPATVYGMSHQDFDSSYGAVQSLKDKLIGTTSDTITAPQLNQLKKDVEALRNEYLNNHEVAYQSFREGIPDRLREKVDKRFAEFRARATSSEGHGSKKSVSLMPEAKADSPVVPHPQDKAAVEWAKANPGDKRSAAILRANGVE